MKLLKTSNWCERYLNKYPSELVKISEIIEGNFLIMKLVSKQE